MSTPNVELSLVVATCRPGQHSGAVGRVPAPSRVVEAVSEDSEVTPVAASQRWSRPRPVVAMRMASGEKLAASTLEPAGR